MILGLKDWSVGKIARSRFLLTQNLHVVITIPPGWYQMPHLS